MDKLVASYIDKGLGVVSFVVLIGMMWFFISKILPVLEHLKSQLEQLKNQSCVHEEVIRNNSSAIRELARSNDNIATALTVLNNAFETHTDILSNHDARAANMEKDITRIVERVKT